MKAPAIPLATLVAASEALKMVKDLPVHASLNKEQWAQVMRASNTLEYRLDAVMHSLPQVEVEI
jgi:hypothetical protein